MFTLLNIFFAIARLTVFFFRFEESENGRRAIDIRTFVVVEREERNKKRKKKKKIDDTLKKLVTPWSFSSRHLALLHGGPNFVLNHRDFVLCYCKR